MKLKDILLEEQFNFVGTCVNSFDEDSGDVTCTKLPYRDVSDFANNWEDDDTKEETKLEFLKYCKVPVELQSILNNKTTEFYFDGYKKVHLMYDVKNDIHYFFTK